MDTFLNAFPFYVTHTQLTQLSVYELDRSWCKAEHSCVTLHCQVTASKCVFWRIHVPINHLVFQFIHAPIKGKFQTIWVSIRTLDLKQQESYITCRFPANSPENFIQSEDAIDHLHKWCLCLSNNTYTSLASHWSEKSFVLKHEYEANDV